MAVATRKRPEGSDWQLIPGRVAVEGFFVVIVEGKNHLGVSEYSGFSPKSCILIGFSIINHPFWGYPYFWKHPFIGGEHTECWWKKGRKSSIGRSKGLGDCNSYVTRDFYCLLATHHGFKPLFFFASCISLKIAPIRIWLLKKKSWNKPMQQQTSTTRCWFMSNSLP